MTGAVLNKREQNAARTREKLVDAAVSLYGSRSIDAVSLREIGVAAGQKNPNALQYHFGDRDGLLQAIVDKHAMAISEVRNSYIGRAEKGEWPAGEAAARCLVMPIIDYVEDLIGPDFFQWGGGFFVKYPGEGNFVPWHQDSQYWPLSPRKTVTASLAFYDGTRDNGAMQVLRGSHRSGQIPHHDVSGKQYMLGQEIDADQIDESQAVAIELKAGEISLHDEALAIAEALAAETPNSLEWQRDLSVSHQKLGMLAADAGNTSVARRHFETSRAIRERLVMLAPDDPTREWDLAGILDRLGELALANDDPSGAMREFTVLEAIMRRLAANEPDNLDWQRDLAVALQKLGGTAARTGNTAAAREHLGAAADILVAITTAAPHNHQWQQDLARTRQLLARLAAD